MPVATNSLLQAAPAAKSQAPAANPPAVAADPRDKGPGFAQVFASQGSKPSLKGDDNSVKPSRDKPADASAKPSTGGDNPAANTPAVADSGNTFPAHNPPAKADDDADQGAAAHPSPAPQPAVGTAPPRGAAPPGTRPPPPPKVSPTPGSQPPPKGHRNQPKPPPRNPRRCQRQAVHWGGQSCRQYTGGCR